MSIRVHDPIASAIRSRVQSFTRDADRQQSLTVPARKLLASMAAEVRQRVSSHYREKERYNTTAWSARTFFPKLVQRFSLSLTQSPHIVRLSDHAEHGTIDGILGAHIYSRETKDALDVLKSANLVSVWEPKGGAVFVTVTEAGLSYT